MIYDVVLVLGIIAVALIAYAHGYLDGKASRKIDLSGIGSQEAFAYFLLHEIHRHREDIAKAKADLKLLDKHGFKPPDIPVGLWIKARK